jgi:HAD superfamily hydrolase (TIGR01549 family)
MEVALKFRRGKINFPLLSRLQHDGVKDISMGRNDNEISAILFDLDGTIRHSRPRGIDIFHKLAFDLGVSFDDEVKKQAERWTHKYFAMSDAMQEDSLSTGGSLSGEFWLKYTRRHLERLGAPQDYLQELSIIITEKMDLSYQPESYISDDVMPALKILKGSGFTLGLITNRNQSITTLLAEHELDGIFDIILTAGEVGYWKPDPRIFYYALQVLKLDAGRAVYIGDNYFADVLGSRAAGLTPILFDPLEIYPSPGCMVIRSIGDLPVLFKSTEPLQPGT